MNEPRTPDEWQVAVDGAHAVAMIEAARKLGFITGGPTVNLDRCAEILDRGKRLGYTADPLSVYTYLNESGAPIEIQQVMAKLDTMAYGGLLAAALLGTPMQGYAIEEFYQPDAENSHEQP